MYTLLVYCSNVTQSVNNAVVKRWFGMEVYRVLRPQLATHRGTTAASRTSGANGTALTLGREEDKRGAW